MALLSCDMSPGVGTALHWDRCNGWLFLEYMIFQQLEKQDLLFVLTAKYHVCILSYDEASGDIITRAYGDVKVIT